MKIPIPKQINLDTFNTNLRNRLTKYDTNLWDEEILNTCIEAALQRVYPYFFLVKTVTIEAGVDTDKDSYIKLPDDLIEIGIVYNDEDNINIMFPFTGIIPNDEGFPAIKIPDEYSEAKLIYSCNPYIAKNIIFTPDIEAIYLASLMVCLEYRATDRIHYDSSPASTNEQSSEAQEVLINAQICTKTYLDYAKENRIERLHTLLAIEEIIINPFKQIDRTPNPGDINYEGKNKLPR